jgi:hypothetical protein
VVGKGKRGLFDEKMNDFVEVLSLTGEAVAFETGCGEIMKKMRKLWMKLG